MKAANYKFTIDGHGADELFSGYQWHFPEIIAGNVARGKMIDAYRPLRYFLNSFPDNYSQISKLVTLMRGIKHYFFHRKILRILVYNLIGINGSGSMKFLGEYYLDY